MKKPAGRARRADARAPSSNLPPKPGLAARQATHRLLAAIVDARTPMDALTDDQNGNPHYLALDHRDRALLRAILMTALRHRGEIDAVIAHLSERPLPPGAAPVRVILHVALAQILYLDVPVHSAADLAVEAANRDPRCRKYSGFVNALCRRADRERETLVSVVAPQGRHLPAWFAGMLVAAYGPERADAILDAHRRQAPIDITAREGSAENLARLARDLDAVILPTGSLRLTGSGEIAALPGFETGDWWVQDAAAALPARLMGNVCGKRVADLCAAPGGKTAQLAAAGADVTALELSANRLSRLRANLERLGLAGCVTAVHGDLFSHEPGEAYDAVLLDAPCSSTGTVRRHPDVPWTKSPEAVAKLADLQARMLDKAAGLVAPGGVLVFSNCSLDPSEGEAVAQAFATAHGDFRIDPVKLEDVPGLETCIDPAGFLRTTPADLSLSGHLDEGRWRADLDGIDGFFAARFRRSG